MDWRDFIIYFTDEVAPKLDTYEQAIYLYLVRHTRLIEIEEAVIPFKSARRRIAFGIGEKGKPMSEGTAYEKLQSLAQKGLVKILSTEHSGRRLSVRLPHEVSAFVRTSNPSIAVDPEEFDFFTLPVNKLLIYERDNRSCFYCLQGLSPETFVIEHIISRPAGNNGFKNVVAACRRCNNRKGRKPVEDYLRLLYREGLLNADEIAKRLIAVECVKKGEMKPDFHKAIPS